MPEGSVQLALCFLLQPVPEFLQLPYIEIRQDLAIYVDARRFGLPGQIHHFLLCFPVAGHVQLLEFDVPFLQPFDGFIAPAAPRFDEQTDFGWFPHKLNRAGW